MLISLRDIFDGCCEITCQALCCIVWIFDGEGAMLRKKLYFPEIRSFPVLGMKKRRQRYAGPRYHASVARGPHELLISGGLKMVALVPGGANGTRLKSCGPSKAWNAEILGCHRDERRRFRESWDRLTRWLHRARGESLS